MDFIKIAEMGYAPDYVIRLAIRRLLAKRLRSLSNESRSIDAFADNLRRDPIAIETDSANSQHYEVPADFFQQVLGQRLKYSCCLFPNIDASLDDAEIAMLDQTCQRAELKDGMRILELGCGWGSLSLWMAENYPSSRITAVSNSTSQRIFIEQQAESLGLANLDVVTADMREFNIRQTFDRVVSVEMFEHMRNYETLFRKVTHWLEPAGKAFLHIFCHRDRPYLFDTDGASNWMGRHFFTGGMMPSEDLFRRFDECLNIEKQWRVNGMHYYRTCEAWLENLDRNHGRIIENFTRALGASRARVQLQRWRIFFLACAELFRYREGTEWFVAHYRFTRT